MKDRHGGWKGLGQTNPCSPTRSCHKSQLLSLPLHCSKGGCERPPRCAKGDVGNKSQERWVFCLHVGNEGAIWWRRTWWRSSGMTAVPFNNISRQETRFWCCSPPPHPIWQPSGKDHKMWSNQLGRWTTWLIYMTSERAREFSMSTHWRNVAFHLVRPTLMKDNTTKFSYEEIVRTIGGKS